MIKSIGIFYGSDTGNTKNVAEMIHKKLGNNITDIFDISQSNKEDLEKYNKLLLGVSTWYYGEVQQDWENFLHNFKKINFKKKTVAIFGCGDQEDYSEYFCDAIGILYNTIKPLGAKLVGKWPINGYNFESSKGMYDKNNFVGLAIDEDRQSNLTNKRIDNWIKQIKKEMFL